MKKRIEILYDVLKNRYLGVKYYPYEIENHLSSFKNFINDDEMYELYSLNRRNRDGENYHTTLFSVPEYNTKREALNNYIDKEVTIVIVGIGQVEKGDNKAFYLIVNSNDLNDVRLDNDFLSKDLHITLGFKQKDIFCPKGIDTMVFKL